MEVYLPSKEDYDVIRKELAEVRSYLKSITKPEEQIFDNHAFIKLMKISDKTAAVWRNESKIGFSQEGKKIYYRMSDIEKFLERYHKKPFAQYTKQI